MTEYDYSPEAWERYIESQHRIARWVDGTLTHTPCNAFAPATPHIKFLELKHEEKKQKVGEKKDRPARERRHSYDHRERKYRSEPEEEDHAWSSSRTSKDRKSHASSSRVSGSSSHRHERPSSRQEHSSRDKEKDRRRERRSSSAVHPREKEKPVVQGEGYVLVEKSRTTHNTPTHTRASTPTSPSRPRSSSHSAPKPLRSKTAPNLSLDLPPVGQAHDPYHHRYPRHSAGGYSSNTRPSSGSTTNGTLPTYQYQTPTPKSAPPATGHAPQPVRSHSMPVPNGHPYPGHLLTSSPDPAKVPQLPFSAYISSPTKGNSTSLLKRMFAGLAINKQGGSKHSSSSKAKDLYALPNGGKRVLRKRSISF